MNILISACLLEADCRYSGVRGSYPELKALAEKYHLIPVCPEQMGGLPTPRTPSEIVGDKVLAKDGRDVTAQFEKGAEEALRMAQLFHCKYAILKANSPSCGYGTIYDGTHSGVLTRGNGKTAELLSRNGIIILNEKNYKEVLL